MKQLMFILLLILLTSFKCYAAPACGAGLACAGVAMGAAALAASEDNREHAIKAHNATLVTPPLNWANAHSCKLQATDDIGVFKCYIERGAIFDTYYMVTVNQQGHVIKTVKTNNNRGVLDLTLLIGGMLLFAVGGCIALAVWLA